MSTISLIHTVFVFWSPSLHLSISQHQHQRATTANTHTHNKPPHPLPPPHTLRSCPNLHSIFDRRRVARGVGGRTVVAKLGTDFIHPPLQFPHPIHPLNPHIPHGDSCDWWGYVYYHRIILYTLYYTPFYTPSFDHIHLCTPIIHVYTPYVTL